jgi:hypothetical protein
MFAIGILALSSPVLGDSDGSEEAENWRLSRSMVWSWIAVIGLLMIWTVLHYGFGSLRQSVTVGVANQKYWSKQNENYGIFKRYILDAPLFRKRHHREFRLSNAINIGTLPSRIQTIFLTSYVAMAVTLTVYGIDWSGKQSDVLDQVVMRTGCMAVMNMLPLFLLSSRNNPLIIWTGIPFDTYNLIHRWLGRIVVIEAVAHGVAWVIGKVQTGKPMRMVAEHCNCY